MELRKEALSLSVLSMVLASLVLALVAPLYVMGGQNALTLVSSTQYNAAGGSSIYPGSKNVRIVLELRNNESEYITGVQGCFRLPWGFKFSAGVSSCVSALSTNGSWVNRFGPGEVFQLRTQVDVSNDVWPGIYRLQVDVTYRLGSEINYVTLEVPIIVSHYPATSLEVVDSWWGSDQVFPGTRGAALSIRVRNPGPSDIMGGYGTITLQQPLKPEKIRVQLPSMPSGSTYVLEVGGVDIPPSATPGSYSVYLDLNVTSRTEDGVTYDGRVVVASAVRVSGGAAPKLVVVDSGWSYGVAYPEGRALSLFVTLQNKDLATINSLVAILNLPEGLRARDGREYVVLPLGRQLSYGDTATLTFSDIVLNVSNRPDIILASLRLEGLASYRGAEFWFNITLPVRAAVVVEDVLRLSSVEWSYQGGVAEALPSSKDVVLNVRLSNLGQDPLTVLKVLPQLPEFVAVKSIGGACFAGVQPGATCLLQMVVDISPNARPGLYDSLLTVTYSSRTGTSILYRTVDLNLQVPISSPDEYSADVVLSKVWWGTAAPTVSYGMEGMQPLHVEITNLGRYAASYVYVRVSAPHTVGVVDGEGVCSTYLSPGTSCRLTPYVNLTMFSGNRLNLTISVNYYVTMYGSNIPVSMNYPASIPVSRYPPKELGNLSLIGFAWLNNNPTYPNTQNATYVISLINRYPYPVTSILGELALPEGFTASKGLNTAYLPGPVQPNQVAQLTFQLNVGALNPGTYEARLRLTYLVNSGGEGVGVGEELRVPILVNGVLQGLELITASWAGRPAEPGTYGNVLLITLRNSEYPSVRGLVADVSLPEGLTSSINNESRVRILAVSSLPQLPTQQIGGSQIQELLRYYTQAMSIQTPTQTQFSKGDYIYFSLPLNVLSAGPGTYYALFNVSFIDHWGNLRTQSFRVPVSVLGSPILIQVWSEGSLSFRESREANMTLKLLNVGTAPAYNVYLAVYPYGSYVILPKTTPIYISRLDPGNVVTLKMPVYINPLPSPQVPASITYGNIPFMAAVVYTTSNGLRQVMNSTFTVSIEPYIKLMLTDVKVIYTGNEVRLSSTLINVGNAQAQRIVARLVGGGVEGSEVFVGDVDPSSQTSFAVSLKLSTYVETVKLVLSYRNPYNEEEVLVREFGVTPVATTTPTVTAPQAVDATLRYGILALVAVFLALVAFILYRYLKTHPVPQVRE
ncbi:MAG: hypothetical protein QXU35_02735 [Zestosphaera sp.]